MNGTKFLFDTNFILGLVKGNHAVVDVLSQLNSDLNNFAYSSISRMELLGFSSITLLEEEQITKLLSGILYLPLTGAIEDETIRIRKMCRIKLPDALILGTARVHCLKLLTLDKELDRIAESI